MDNKITNSRAKSIWLFIPFILIGLFSAAFFAGALLFAIYTIVVTVAFESALTFFFLFACAAFAAGIGLSLVIAVFRYKDYYDRRMKERVAEEMRASAHYKNSKISVYVLLIAGVISVIISSAFGALDKDKWVEARTGYFAENGYFPYPILIGNLSYDGSKIDTVEISLENKNAVVIYRDHPSKSIEIAGYMSYEDQILLKNEGNTLTISERPDPREDGALEKMLFFLFNENQAEKQLRIYIPNELKSKITIIGEYIVAKS